MLKPNSFTMPTYLNDGGIPQYSELFPAQTNASALGSSAPMGTLESIRTEVPGMWDSFKSGFLGSTNKDGLRTDGWGGMALGTATGLFNAYMGMKQYGLFKDQLQFQKDSFNKNYDAQRTATNTQLQDRQTARVASNPGAYQSVGDYMNQNRIK